jgi:hypothetical protein
MLLACQQEPEKNNLKHYFPSEKRLSEGIVNKYYSHYKAFDGFTESTTILYDEIRLNEEGQLHLIKYDVGFKPLREQFISFDPAHMRIEQMQRFFRDDTIEIKMQQPSYLSKGNVDFDHSYTYDWLNEWKGSSQMWSVSQKDSSHNVMNFIIQKDSLVELFYHPEKDSVKSSMQNRTLFASGIGLYDQRSVLAKGTLHLELIEQIPLKHFEKMKQHGLKRIAYINPKKSLTDDLNFHLCDKEADILDYYNTDPDSHHPHKDSLRMQLAKSIDTNKLKQESGYLTFRFVMNCKGERGRYICEEANLDFEPKRFDKEVRDYLLKQVIKTKGWKPQPLGEETRDAYVYITFRLKDGKIIELLP